jgi:hypothetical protein
MVSLQAWVGRQKLPSEKYLRGCRGPGLLQRADRRIASRHSFVSVGGTYLAV